MARKNKWLYFLSNLICHIFINGAERTVSEIKCFNTVLYHNSNPKISGKRGTEYVYENDNFHEATFHLNCDIYEENLGIIYVKSVVLMIPASENDYCLESKTTDYRKCSSESPCICCELPDNACKAKASLQYDACDNHKDCKLSVRSEFLSNCTSITYDCDYQKCHSRWAEVTYQCGEYIQPPAERESITTDRTTVAVLGTIIIALVFLLIIVLWIFRKQIYMKMQEWWHRQRCNTRDRIIEQNAIRDPKVQEEQVPLQKINEV